MRRALVVVTALVAVGLAACGDTEERGASQQPQGASLRVTIGTQEFPEARILGELLRKGIGPAADLDEALQDGDVDGYVAYTGTVLSIVAGEEVSGLDPEETYDQPKAFYAGQDMAQYTALDNGDADAVDAMRSAVSSPRAPWSR